MRPMGAALWYSHPPTHLPLAVRLPFRWLDLDAPPNNLDKDCSPVTVDFLKNRLISPNVRSR